MSTGTFPGLEPYLAQERARVEEALERAVDRVRARLEGHPEIAEAVAHGVLSGGKRLRPILCVAAWTACRERIEVELPGSEPRAPGGGPVEPTTGTSQPTAVYDLASSLEMIHAYSLMHDDLPCMDDAELRRGRPTTHRVHGEAATMRAGAVLIPEAARRALTACEALGCPETSARAATRALLEASGAGGMVGGQWIDLLGEGQSFGAEELDGLHRRKTGALLAASLVVGAIAAGADEARRGALERYGRAIGLAFQIADDVLDATADAETLGKNPSDAALDKSTYVSLYGLAEARRRARAQVDQALGALDDAGVHAPALEALARYVVERGR